MTKRKTTEQFKQEVYDLVGDEYTVLGEYKNTDTKLKMKHNVCGHNYEVKPANFLHGNRCPQCSNNIKKTTEQFKQEIYDLVGDEYSVLGEYTNAKTKIMIKHNKCGYKYKTSPNAFLNGRRCSNCYNANKRKTTEQFKQEIYNLVGDEYTLKSKYIDSRLKVNLLHNKCGEIYCVRPDMFLQGQRCQCNKKLKGEEEIARYLQGHHIVYERQETFDWLVYKSKQTIDFYLPDYNLAIEYDGEQHFKPVQFGGISLEQATNKYKVQIKKDANKNKLLKEHNIKLLRIPYWEKDSIENVLNKVLTK